MGVSVGGKDPNSTLSARLSRAQRIINIRQRGWWIKGKADDAVPAKETSPALFQPQDNPEDRERSVAHEKITDTHG